MPCRHVALIAAVAVRRVERRDGEEAQGLLDVVDVDVLAELHLGEGLRDADNGLELAHRDGDGALVLHLLADGDVVVLQDLRRVRRQPGRALGPAAVR